MLNLVGVQCINEEVFAYIRLNIYCATMQTHFNPELEFWIETDASKYGIGGVLIQQNGVLQLVGTVS